MQLFHRLRHRIVEKRHQRHFVDNRLHGALQNLCLRASHLRQRWRPTPAELLIKDVEELGPPATGSLLAPWGAVLHVLHQLLLQRDRTARGVVELFSQGHCDAHPFVPKHRTEASLPPPPRRARGTMGAISTRAIRWVLKHHGHTNKETRV